MEISFEQSLVESFANLEIETSSDDNSTAGPDIDYIPTPKSNRNLSTLNVFVKDVRGRSISPVRSQCNLPVSEMASSTLRYYKKKTSQVCEAVMHCIAPGQTTALFELLKDDKDRYLHDEDGAMVEKLISLYEETQSAATKTEILSLFAKDYTKTQLKEMIPGLSIWCIDEARKHATIFGCGKPIEQETIHRSRMDPVKVDHFVDFISRPDYVQDVAFGTKTLKLENGEELRIPNVVRTVTSCRLVKLYKSFCEENTFVPLGRSTLFSILKVRPRAKLYSIKL